MLSPLVVLVISGVGAHFALAQCPFSKALQSGQLLGELIDRRKQELIKEGFLLNVGQPAALIWYTAPLDTATQDLFNRSVVLQLAKQMYVQQQLIRLPTANMTPTAIAALLLAATECAPLESRCSLPAAHCDESYQYRLAGGGCNNRRQPKWGAARTAYGRLMPAQFDDGISTIRRSELNAQLPSPRVIGNEIAGHWVFQPVPERRLNAGALMFGQYVAHDAGLRDVYQNPAGGPGLSCCPRDSRVLPAEQLSYYGCDPIEVPRDDPFYRAFGAGCISYVRSQPVFADDCSLQSTEMSNSCTSFIDQSNIYGSDERTSRDVREHRAGRLLIANGVAALQPNCTGGFCYYTGDIRAMPNPTLAVWHSVFIRYHNKLAARLAAINPQWCGNDELLFQQTRRILTAVYQNIVFNEWLPLLVGDNVLGRRNVSCAEDSGYCGQYDERVDPSNLNEFGAGVFRQYHAHTPEYTNLYDENFLLINSTRLVDSIHGATILEKHCSDVMRGLLKDPMHVGKYPSHIRNEIFKDGNSNGIGLDLLSVDIARGRDHGLSPYHVYLERSTNGKHIVRRWNDLGGIFSQKSINALKSVYTSVFDIDLLVGLLMESKRGVYTGPVGQYLMEQQFYRFKFGDRFFYSTEGNSNPFTEEQILEINRQKFANVLCASSDIAEVFERSFEVHSSNNPRIRCCSLEPINLSLWSLI